MATSRKDYRAIAEAIRETRENYPDGDAGLALHEAALKIADYFRVAGGFDTNGNRRFDTDRFMEATR